MKKILQSRLETAQSAPLKFGSDPRPPPNIYRPEKLKSEFQTHPPSKKANYGSQNFGRDSRLQPNNCRPQMIKHYFQPPLPSQATNYRPPNLGPEPRPPPNVGRPYMMKPDFKPIFPFESANYGLLNFGLVPPPPPPPNIYIPEKIKSNFQPPLPVEPPPPGLESWKRVGLTDHLVTFKSSPDLNNMKKVIQSRLEITNNVAINFAPDPQPPPNIHRQEVEKTKFQPPLPLDPPPQDNLVSNLQVKQEIEDPAYLQNNNQNGYIYLEAESHNKFQSIVDTPQQEVLEDKRPICRDFNRGRCDQRPGTCRFAHRYEFCRQYQNAVCTFLKCKFVHANIFEEQEYYRSGYLPPHVFSHHVMLPPPPPPPEEPPVQFNFKFSNQPAPMQNVMDKPFIHCLPGTSRDSRPFIDNMGPQIPTSTSSLKREWNHTEQFPAPPCDSANNEQLAKKCKHCDIMEYRLQFNKNKVDQMIQTKEELNKKSAILDAQNDKLSYVIMSLLKPSPTAKMQANPNAVNGDKEYTLWDQLNNLLNSNNRMSTLGQDN